MLHFLYVSVNKEFAYRTPAYVARIILSSLSYFLTPPTSFRIWTRALVEMVTRRGVATSVPNGGTRSTRLICLGAGNIGSWGSFPLFGKFTIAKHWIWGLKIKVDHGLRKEKEKNVEVECLQYLQPGPWVFIEAVLRNRDHPGRLLSWTVRGFTLWTVWF